MSLQFKIGLDAITSYKRLAYTAWHAIAEFVDNSTQSYFDYEDELKAAYLKEDDGLHISVTYDRDWDNGQGLLRIADNAMGMSYEDLDRALHIAQPPDNPTGRSRYGMGLKTAACWIGDLWKIRTKMLGDTQEYSVEVDVNAVATGQAQLPFETIPDRDPDLHYTIIEIEHHNQIWRGRTLGKIRDYLRSMYREDFRREILTLEWQGEALTWEDFPLEVSQDGSPLRKDFDFSIDGKQVNGWVGILATGYRGRANAGFSIIHSGRVVRGWPTAWRPHRLYGQIEGSNDLVNQRLVGEIHLDEFDVSHTKDGILWIGEQEDEVDRQLYEHCVDYRNFARDYRPTQEEQPGPSEVETLVAIDELKRELESPEMVDKVELKIVPPEQVIAESNQHIIESVEAVREPTLCVTIGQQLVVKVYLVGELSANDPYVITEAAHTSEVVVIVNSSHPHWGQLRGSEGIFNYLQHCVYDGVAEWQARSKVSSIQPSTIRRLKDNLLRVTFETIEISGDFQEPD